MNIKKIDFQLFQKSCPSQPSVKYLENEFRAFIDYCDENNYMPSKHNWYIFLSATRQQINSWKNASRGTTTISDEEFNARRDMLKKIEDFIEESMSHTLITSERPLPNLMIYMKNSFKWTDRPQQEEIQINVKTPGFLPNKKRKNGKK